MQFTSSNTTDYSSRFSTAANQLYSFDTNGQSVTLAGNLTSNGGSLTKLGTGTLTLSGANTYTNGTDIQNGTLVLGSGGTLASGYLYLGSAGSSGIFQLGDSNNAVNTTVSYLLGLAGGTSNAIVGGNSSTASVLTIDNSATDPYSGKLGGSTATSQNLALTMAGTGILILSGTNTYTGGTTLDGGELSLGSAGAIGTTGTITFGGGTLQFTSSNTTDYSSRFSTSSNQLYSFDTNGQSVILAGNLTSSGGSLTKIGTGTLTLSGSDTYTGGTTINAGTLQIGGPGNLGSTSGTLTVNTGGTLDLNGTSQTVGNLIGTGTILNNSAGTNKTLTIGSGNGTGGNYAGVIENNSGTGGTLALTKTGTGTLTLSGTNTYTGTSTVSAGTLQFANEVSLYNNTTASWTSTNIIVKSGATLAFNVGGTGQFTSTNISSLLALGTANGGFESGSAIGLDTTDAVGGNFTYSNTIANPNGGANVLGLTKLGTGTLTLTGANTYTGTTTVSAGALDLDYTGGG